MTKDDKEIVSALRAALVDRVGKDRCDVWLGDDTLIEWVGGGLRVVAPNAIAADLVRKQLRRDLEATAAAVVGRVVVVEIAVADDPPASLLAAPPSSGAAKAAKKGKPRAASGPSDADVAPPTKFAARRPWETLEAFVVGPSNRLAWTTATTVAEQLGRYSPLLIHGPNGVGKSHLLEGICHATRQRRGATAVLLTAEQFLSQFQDAVRGAGMPSFRRKFRGVDLLAIDDVQFLAGKVGTLGELAQTVETMSRDGRQVVFTADRPPAELHELGPDLCRRIQGGMTCRLDPPELETRCGIVRRIAAARELSLPEEVARLVAAQFLGSARELCGAVNVLEMSSRAWDRPVTLALAEEALAELVAQNARVVRLTDIEHAVCDVFGLDPSALQSQRKAHDVAQPRMLAMWLARKYTRVALSEIGRYFGRRSHATVAAAHKKVDEWMAARAPLTCVGRDWPVEETLRRVELRLAM